MRSVTVAGVRWELFVYRLPSEPSRARVAVWREVRRLGALPLQNSVVAVPAHDGLTTRLDAIEARVAAEAGSSYRFRLDPGPDMGRRLAGEWNALRDAEYAEIVEECDTKFVREIEFEIFRGNLTASEAEEIEADLDKIKQWLSRVDARDVFVAGGRGLAHDAVTRCEKLLEDFVHQVYQAETAAEAERGPALDRPVDIPWGRMDGDRA